MGLYYDTEHIEHFLHADLDWPAVLRLVSNDKASYILDSFIQGCHSNNMMAHSYLDNAHLKCNSSKLMKNAIKCTHMQCPTTAAMKSGSLMLHCKDAHKWGMFKCDKCDFTSYREGALKAHKKDHVTRKAHKTDFYCKKCDMYYKSAQSIRQHYVEYHPNRGLIIQKCLFCPFSQTISRKQAWTHHYRGHFSFKYECEICGAKFVKNHNLNRNVLIC